MTIHVQVALARMVELVKLAVTVATFVPAYKDGLDATATKVRMNCLAFSNLHQNNITKAV